MPISDIMHSGDLKRRVDALEKRLREITSGRRLEDASVGARGIQIIGGGNLTVDGGTVRLVSNLGVELARFGPSRVNGNPEWRFAYDGGGSAINLQGDSGRQLVAIRDRSGNIVMSTDAESGAGIARPWLNLRLVPTPEAQQDGTSFVPSTDAGSALKLWQGINPIFHPKITIGIGMAGAGGGTGHWSMEINGETVIADRTSSGVQTVNVPGWGDDIDPGDVISIDVFGWVDPGPGRVYIQCDRIYAEQS